MKAISLLLLCTFHLLPIQKHELTGKVDKVYPTRWLNLFQEYQLSSRITFQIDRHQQYIYVKQSIFPPRKLDIKSIKVDDNQSRYIVSLDRESPLLSLSLMNYYGCDYEITIKNDGTGYINCLFNPETTIKILSWTNISPDDSILR